MRYFQHRKKETGGQDNDYRQHVHHKVNEQVTGRILLVLEEHFSRMSAETHHAISVKTHDDYWRPLAEPFEKLQYAP